MFQEVLDFSLQFIAAHSVDEGCTSADLADFLNEDVFPYCGWAGNVTLRDAVLRLLLTEHSESFSVHKPTGSGAAPPSTSSQKAAACGAAATGRWGAALKPEAVLELLDRGSVQWGSGQEGDALLRLCPSFSLREKLFGLAIGTECLREVTDFVSVNSLQGWDTFRNSPENKKYRQHLISSGLGVLRRRQVVTLCYLIHPVTLNVFYRYFPKYAQPLSECEKADCWKHPLVDTTATTSSSSSSVDLLTARRFRGNRPLDHYFARKRAACGTFSYYVMDLHLVRQVVATSPDRKLLMQDALHAMFAAHGMHSLKSESFGRQHKKNLKLLIAEAGLRIVVAAILLRGQRRTVRLVIPQEDLVLRLKSSRGRKAEAGVKAEDGAEEFLREEDCSDQDEPGNEMDAEDEEEEAVSKSSAPSRTSAMEDAQGPFFVSPEWPLHELQVGREAERRPVAVTSVYPHMSFNYPDRPRLKSLGGAVEFYTKTRGTLTSSLTLAKKAKTFTRVYTSKQYAMLMAGGANNSDTTNMIKSEIVKEEPTDPTAEEPSMLPAAAAQSSPVLPKGIAQYSIDVIMEVLTGSTHGAATLNKLQRHLDYKALTKKLLPYLREQEKVYTTGITIGRRRHGIIALASVQLDDDAKRAVVEECSEAAPASSGRAAVIGAPVRTDIVLSALPALAKGEHRSAHGQKLALSSARAMRTVQKVMAIRNGYARHALYRASRMHLELWHQWYRGNEALRESDLPCLRPEESPMTVQSLFDNMSLSTFCITIGFSPYDLATIVGIQDTPAAAAGGDAASSPYVPSGAVQWGTPLHALPPSVLEWCRQQGTSTLLHSLHLLQERQLISSPHTIDSFTVASLESLTIFLSSEGRSGAHTYALHAASYTPSSTMHAVLRYWMPTWGMVTHTSLAHSRSVYKVDPNMGIPRLLVLNKVARYDLGVLAETLYQCCGNNRSVKRARFLDLRFPQGGTNAKKESRGSAATRHRRGGRRVFRSEISGSTVAEALEAILEDPEAPQKRIDDLFSHIDRACRNNFGVNGLGSFAEEEANPGAAYNRYHKQALLHVSTLSRTFRQVAKTHRITPAGMNSTSLLTRAKLTESLQNDVISVFHPDASAAVNDGGATAADNNNKASLAAVAGINVGSAKPRGRPVKHPAELGLDALRMILLSDRTHYRASAVRDLLSVFPSRDVTHARNYLQRQPAFCRSRHDRLPDIGLVSRPSFFLARFLRVAPRPCANASLLHSWARSLENTGTVSCGGGSTSRLAVPWTRAEVEGHHSAFDVSVEKQPAMDAPAEESMAVLRLPLLAWPPESYAMEEPARRAVSVKRKRKREADDGDGDGDGEENEDAADHDDADEHSKKQTAKLYPARALAFSEEEVVTGLESIPTDPPPTAEEQAAVATALAQIRASTEGVGRPAVPATTTAAPLPYPSIFHHVDGSFHTYVWRSFLFSLHRFVLRLPGVSHDRLMEKAMASGLLSHRSVEAGLTYLVGCGVLARQISGLSAATPAASCSGPFGNNTRCGTQGAAAGEEGVTYSVTVPPHGLWDVIQAYERESHSH